MNIIKWLPFLQLVFVATVHAGIILNWDDVSSLYGAEEYIGGVSHASPIISYVCIVPQEYSSVGFPYSEIEFMQQDCSSPPRFSVSNSEFMEFDVCRHSSEAAYLVPHDRNRTTSFSWITYPWHCSHRILMTRQDRILVNITKLDHMDLYGKTDKYTYGKTAEYTYGKTDDYTYGETDEYMYGYEETDKINKRVERSADGEKRLLTGDGKEASSREERVERSADGEKRLLTGDGKEASSREGAKTKGFNMVMMIPFAVVFVVVVAILLFLVPYNIRRNWRSRTSGQVQQNEQVPEEQQQQQQQHAQTQRFSLAAHGFFEPPPPFGPPLLRRNDGASGVGTRSQTGEGNRNRYGARDTFRRHTTIHQQSAAAAGRRATTAGSAVAPSQNYVSTSGAQAETFNSFAEAIVTPEPKYASIEHANIEHMPVDCAPVDVVPIGIPLESGEIFYARTPEATRVAENLRALGVARAAGFARPECVPIEHVPIEHAPIEHAPIDFAAVLLTKHDFPTRTLPDEDVYLRGIESD